MKGRPLLRAWPPGAFTRALVLLLMCTLPLHGHTGVVLSILGPAHWHHATSQDPVADSTLVNGLSTLLKAIRSPASYPVEHASPRMIAAPEVREHDHGGLARHRHELADADVEVVGASDLTTDATLAGLGSVMLAFALSTTVRPWLTADAVFSWPSGQKLRWRSRTSPPIERPPRAG